MPTIASSLFPGRSLSCFHLECSTASSHICLSYIWYQVYNYSHNENYYETSSYIYSTCEICTSLLLYSYMTYCAFVIHALQSLFAVVYNVHVIHYFKAYIIACIFCCYRGLIWLKIMQMFNSIIIASPLYWYFERIYRTAGKFGRLAVYLCDRQIRIHQYFLQSQLGPNRQI